MGILPGMSVVSVGECAPGDLIRFRDYSSKTFAFGLVGMSSDGKRHIVRLVPASPKDWISYMTWDSKMNVVSYGREYDFEIDHRGEMGAGGSQLAERNGVIIAKSDRWMMGVAPSQPEFGQDTRYYDIETGEFASGEPSWNDAIVFLGWQIRLRSAAPFAQGDIVFAREMPANS